MDNYIEESKRSSTRKGRADMKVSQTRNRRCREYGVTRKEFHALIKKASRPIKHEAESDSEKSET